MDSTRVRVIAMAFALLMHLLLCSLYIFRDSVAPRMAGIATSYCSPLFHQNWMLFAPNVSEYDVQLQFCTDIQHPNNWNEVIGVSNGASPIDRAERYFANALTWDYVGLVFPSDDTLNFDSFVQSRSYQNARKWLCHYLQYSNMELADSLQIRLMFTFYDAKNPHGPARLDSIQLPTCSCVYRLGVDVNNFTE